MLVHLLSFSFTQVSWPYSPHQREFQIKFHRWNFSLIIGSSTDSSGLQKFTQRFHHFIIISSFHHFIITSVNTFNFFFYYDAFIFLCHVWVSLGHYIPSIIYSYLGHLDTWQIIYFILNSINSFIINEFSILIFSKLGISKMVLLSDKKLPCNTMCLFFFYQTIYQPCNMYLFFIMFVGPID